MKADDFPQKEFIELSEKCKFRTGEMCSKTTFACRDFLCFIIQTANNREEAIKLFKEYAAK